MREQDNGRFRDCLQTIMSAHILSFRTSLPSFGGPSQCRGLQFILGSPVEGLLFVITLAARGESLHGLLAARREHC